MLIRAMLSASWPVLLLGAVFITVGGVVLWQERESEARCMATPCPEGLTQVFDLAMDECWCAVADWGMGK